MGINYLDLRLLGYGSEYSEQEKVSLETENSKYCYNDAIILLVCLKGTATFDTGDTDYTVSENMFFSTVFSFFTVSSFGRQRSPPTYPIFCRSARVRADISLPDRRTMPV